MKKLLSLVLLCTALLCAFCACQTPAPTPPTTDPTVRIAGMKGPTSLGLLSLAEKAEAGQSANKYEIDMSYGKADAILPKLLGGEVDMAALPANVAASLYNNSNGKITVLAINTLGVVEIVERGESIQSLSDLVGKTIYAVGKGTTPEYALRYLCAENGINYDDLTIEWRNEATEILPLLKTEAGAVAMLPQPFVTAAELQIEDLRSAIRLKDAWEALDNGSTFVTGVMVVRSAFLAQYPGVVADFLSEYDDSVMATPLYPSKAAALAVAYGLLASEAIADIAVLECAQVYIGGAAMKEALSSYLATLYDLAPASIGGKMPKDDFYYVTATD